MDSPSCNPSCAAGPFETPRFILTCCRTPRYLQADLKDSTSNGLPTPFPPQVYDILRAMARSRMSNERSGHTLQGTALVHEAMLRMTQEGRITAADRPEFFRAAAETMRRILIDHA